MPSFGEKLKLEREKRKITLEQISASTKIGTRMLQALEEDKFNQLPGGIFNKGFVRAYSRCVGLDEDQTVADYLQASGDAHPASAELEFREDGSREEDSARKNEENLSRLEETVSSAKSNNVRSAVTGGAVIGRRFAPLCFAHPCFANTRFADTCFAHS